MIFHGGKIFLRQEIFIFPSPTYPTIPSQDFFLTPSPVEIHKNVRISVSPMAKSPISPLLNRPFYHADHFSEFGRCPQPEQPKQGSNGANIHPLAALKDE